MEVFTFQVFSMSLLLCFGQLVLFREHNLDIQNNIQHNKQFFSLMRFLPYLIENEKPYLKKGRRVTYLMSESSIIGRNRIIIPLNYSSVCHPFEIHCWDFLTTRSIDRQIEKYMQIYLTLYAYLYAQIHLYLSNCFSCCQLFSLQIMRLWLQLPYH